MSGAIPMALYVMLTPFIGANSRPAVGMCDFGRRLRFLRAVSLLHNALMYGCGPDSGCDYGGRRRKSRRKEREAVAITSIRETVPSHRQ